MRKVETPLTAEQKKKIIRRVIKRVKKGIEFHGSVFMCVEISVNARNMFPKLFNTENCDADTATYLIPELIKYKPVEAKRFASWFFYSPDDFTALDAANKSRLEILQNVLKDLSV